MGGAAWVGTAGDGSSTAREAVGELFAVHYRRLVGLAMLLVDDRETAEDVVQEAFAGLFARWGRLRDRRAASAYLQRSVVNGSRSRLRRRAIVRAHESSPRAGVESAEATGLDRVEQRALVEAVRQLPRRQREVMVLRYFLDLSEAEIADWLDISRGSVKRHAARATATLRQKMGAWA
jgi:RNA polymerase sigma-70 factor (sigma-E family)